ncbi:p21-activated protein kinase-interacting protein 1-like protein [Mitosporidium daphniae]
MLHVTKLIVGTYERLIFVFDILKTPEGAEPNEYTIKKAAGFKIHEGPILTLSASKSMLVSGTADELKLTNMERYQESGILLQAQEGTKTMFFLVSLTKSILHEEKFLFVAFEDGTISVLSIADSELIKKLTVGKGKASVTDFAIHPSGKILMAVCRKKATAALFDLIKGQRVVKTKLPMHPDSIRFSPLGTKYAILAQKGLECRVNIHELFPASNGVGSDSEPTSSSISDPNFSRNELPKSEDATNANISSEKAKADADPNASKISEKSPFGAVSISSGRKITAMEFISEESIAIAEHPNLVSIYSLAEDRPAKTASLTDVPR